jgi:hypothetical protein
MPNKIERLSSVTSEITATNSASTSPKIPFGSAAGGVIIVDSVASGATTITWNVAFGPELTPRPLNADGAGVTTTIAANNAYSLPDALFGAPFIVAVTNAGTATFRLAVKG